MRIFDQIYCVAIRSHDDPQSLWAGFKVIYTITLNPALDRHLFLPELEYGTAMHCPTVEVFAGGKGINVSRAVRILGGKTMASGFIGRHTGERVLLMLHGEGIACDFIRIERETRICTFIHELSTCRELKLNTPGPFISPTELTCFMERVYSWHVPRAIVVVSGSAPDGVQPSIYKELVARFKLMGMLIFIDAAGKNLQSAIEARPYLIAPNSLELAEIFDFDPYDINAVVEIALRMSGKDAYIVVITMGEKGAVVACDGRVVHFTPPAITAVDTTGAGDAVTGGMAWCMEKGYDVWDAARFATACGTASVMMRGGGSFSMVDLKSVLKQIEVSRLA